MADLTETVPASHVLSSQILGYDGGEVDTSDHGMVEVIFSVNVRKAVLNVFVII